MRTPKQIAASRANGARSKGPVTPAGKRNSSRNSTRHGMFADTLVLEREVASQFHELLSELLDEHKPCTPTQTMLVETIVAARWRQRRIWGIQKTNFDYDIASVEIDSENPALRAALALRTKDESIRSHELLLRFEIALDRQISRSLHRLQQLQDRRAQRQIETPKSKKSSKERSERTSDPDAKHPTPKPKPRALKPAPAKAVLGKRTQQPIETKPEASPNPAPKPATSAPQNRPSPTAASNFSLTGVKHMF